jgi:hypothetical protein
LLGSHRTVEADQATTRFKTGHERRKQASAQIHDRDVKEPVEMKIDPEKKEAAN